MGWCQDISTVGTPFARRDDALRSRVLTAISAIDRRKTRGLITMQALSPNPEGSPAVDCASMTDIRREIDRIDRALVRLLAQRLTYIERAGHIKADRKTVRDEARITDVLMKVKANCAREDFPYSIAEPVWRQLMEGCIAHEFDVFDEVNRTTPRAKLAVQ